MALAAYIADMANVDTTSSAVVTISITPLFAMTAKTTEPETAAITSIAIL